MTGKKVKKTKAKKPIPKKDLSLRHKDFIDRYMSNGYNGTRAYLDVYKGSSYDAAKTSAADLLTNPNVKAELAKRFEARAMGSEEIIARLSDMGRANYYPFIEIDEDGFVYFDFSSEEGKNHLYLIKKIKTKRNRRIVGKGEDAEAWEGEWVEVELHDSKDALIQLAKYRKLFEPDPEGPKFTAPQVVELIRTVEKRDEEEDE